MSNTTHISFFIKWLIILLVTTVSAGVGQEVLATNQKINTASEEDAICGVWFTKNNNSKVEIYKKNGLYFGKIIWLKNTAKGDFTNKTVISDMIYNQSRRVWEQGNLYYPVKDEQYQGIIELSGKDTLSIRAYLGKPVFGKTLIWTRAK